MVILIKSPAGENATEWAIIELQGDLKSHSESSFEGQFVGDLHFTKSGTPLLIIGHHLLYGKETRMEKPLALLEKKKNDAGIEYVIKCIVRKKIIFKTRPKPIVGATT
ncbi:chromosome transmission fidelity protein 8 homolog [Cylas formicarius]|uniref:chromosome transmission fidelity protein 8 homolog n=1 Tax=Cylas formicarius TaxID=197179 RepID=UPI0029585C2A|nr:chromosome transmission fidelity protein 8 homolog [Cylas formicarius]